MSIHIKLATIQRLLKSPKGQRNSFGNYNYRSCEDIVEAAKPVMSDVECSLTLSDEIVEVGGRVYVKATATLHNASTDAVGSITAISVTGYAREAASKKGMDEAQITGSASSYARKYALNGLFAIDDTKDADTDNYQHQQQNSKPEPANATTAKSVNAMRNAIAETDPSSCLEAWAELSKQEKSVVWKQFSKTEQVTIEDLLKVARGE